MILEKKLILEFIDFFIKLWYNYSITIYNMTTSNTLKGKADNTMKDNNNDEHPENPDETVSSDEFFALWSTPTTVKSELTDEDKTILSKLPESVKTFDLEYHGTINVYQHNDHGYVFTTDKRDHDGLLIWFLASGEELRISPIHFWAKPTKHNVDDEKKWLQKVTLIGSFKNEAF